MSQTDSVSVDDAAGSRMSTAFSRSLSSVLGPLIGLALVIAIFGVWKTRLFLAPGTFGKVLDQNFYIAVAAVGMTFVIVTAGIDLSVGSTMALACVVCAMAIRGIQFPERSAGTTIGIGSIAALLVGICVGAR